MARLYQRYGSDAVSELQSFLLSSRTRRARSGRRRFHCGLLEDSTTRSLSRGSCEIPCADPETNEVFAKFKLIPLRNSELDDADADKNTHGSKNSKKPASFAKTLTQSDANNGGGFSVPRYCAETIFPKLDYSTKPPVQTVIAKDVHGEIWKFRHIYRGTPRRHLLTTGWSTFVNQKKEKAEEHAGGSGNS